MPKNPSFELFEVICRELSSRSTLVIPEDDINSELLEDIKQYFNETDGAVAFDRAIEAIRAHLTARGTDLPFSFNKQTREFTALDKDYIDFVAVAVNRRG